MMNRYSFSRPDEAVKAFNAAYSEIAKSHKFSWITEMFWGEFGHIDDDSMPEEIAESLEALLYVSPETFDETYDRRKCVDFLDYVNTVAKSFVDNLIIECAPDTAENLIAAGRNGDDEAISAICVVNKCIIHYAAQYFVHTFCKYYGVHYDEFWNKKVI